MFPLLHLLPMSISGHLNCPLVPSDLGMIMLQKSRLWGLLDRKCHDFSGLLYGGVRIQLIFRVDLLKGSRGSNLYTMSLEEMMQSSPICLLSKASKTRSWLWHQRWSHLNFGAINDLAKQGKSKKHTHKPKSYDSIQVKLYLLHMDLCGPMRIESINGKMYIMVIIDDYSWFTWAIVCNVPTDNGTEFVNQTLKAYNEDVKISHQTSVARTALSKDGATL
ncbi:retrovirus-related pol polyprotein from transposon TNT 1-94 [Tanacetum coccineum]